MSSLRCLSEAHDQHSLKSDGWYSQWFFNDICSKSERDVKSPIGQISSIFGKWNYFAATVNLRRQDPAFIKIFAFLY